MIMKKFIAMATLVLLGLTATHVYAQETKAERKAQRDARRAEMKAEEAQQAEVSFEEAVEALKTNQFVLEANQLQLPNGNTVFVDSNTNFVLVNEQRGTVQTAFNTPYPGPNGIGGVTVDGSVSGMEIKTDKKGNYYANFNIQGIGISATVFITLTNGGNNASVTVSPNFNNRNMTLQGSLVPLNQSNIFKGRSW